MMQRNPERLAMSLKCPYTWLAGVTYSAPGGGYETKPLGTALPAAILLKARGKWSCMKQGKAPFCHLPIATGS